MFFPPHDLARTVQTSKRGILKKILLKHFVWRTARENLEVIPVLALRQMLAKGLENRFGIFYHKVIAR